MQTSIAVHFRPKGAKNLRLGTVVAVNQDGTVNVLDLTDKKTRTMHPNEFQRIHDRKLAREVRVMAAAVA